MYEGKTTKCHPSIEFPKGWHVTHTANHWCNEETEIEYIESGKLGLSPTHTGLVILDHLGPDNSKDLKLIGGEPSYVYISACQLY